MCATAAQPRTHILSKVRVRKRRPRPDMGSSNLQAHPPATASTTRPRLLILPQTVLPRTKHSNRWYEPMGPFLLRSPWRQWLSSVNEEMERALYKIQNSILFCCHETPTDRSWAIENKSHRSPNSSYIKSSWKFNSVAIIPPKGHPHVNVLEGKKKSVENISLGWHRGQKSQPLPYSHPIHLRKIRLKQSLTRLTFVLEQILLLSPLWLRSKMFERAASKLRYSVSSIGTI